MAAVYQKPGIFLAKQIAALTGNTWEALLCVIWPNNYPEGVSRPFKVLTLVHAKMIYIIPLYVGTYNWN